MGVSVLQVVLSACSTYFDKIFSEHEEKDPVVILKDCKFVDIKALVEFMYKGEINVENVSTYILSVLRKTARRYLTFLSHSCTAIRRTAFPEAL